MASESDIPGAGSFGEPAGTPPSRDDLPTSAHAPSSRPLAPGDLLGESPGDSLGNYQLIRVLGEGGFGVVWLALQREPMVRQVALKVLKPGMDSRQVLARFEQERQALALMDHPNVARVFDAGATPSGRPYFVMELVRGAPITTYADEKKLSVAQRLELFVSVCEAIQHAHTKGIIHRDIKPSNVLVEEVDDKPSVKVIDFGVAKAIEHALTDKTLFTETGQIVGTPEYMSPEQADADHRKVDTRTDVYSLGVMLYELLTGALPFDPGTLRSAGYREIQRIIREVDPPKPSARLSSLGALANFAAQNRKTGADELSGELRRELEWIPLKAMRKEAEARYQSAGELAQDVRAYLSGKPLAAGPESQLYRARKFVRRNKAGVAAAGIMLLLGLGAIGALAFGFVENRRAFRESQRAVEQTAKALEASQEAEAEARRSLDRVRRTSAVLEEMLSFADPSADRRFLDQAAEPGRDVTVRDVLDATARRLSGGELASQPLIEGDVRITCAEAYSNVGDANAARVQAERAVEIFRASKPADTLRLALALAALGQAHLVAAEPAAARAALDEALSLLDSAPGVNPAWKARVQLLRARAADLEGNSSDARQGYALALATLNSAPPGSVDHRIAEVRLLQGVAELRAGDPAAARAHLQTAADALAKLYGKSSTQNLGATIQLGHALQQTQDAQGAEATFRSAVAIAEELFPAGSMQLADARQALGRLLMQTGRVDQAEPLIRAALEFRRARAQPNSLELAQGLDDLGFVLRARAQPEPALEAYREALQIHQRRDGGNSLNSAPILVALADTLTQLGRPEEALPLAQEAVRIRTAKLPPSHWSIATARSVLGAALLALQRPAEAKAELSQAVEALSKNHGGSPARLADAQKRLRLAEDALNSDQPRTP